MPYLQSHGGHGKAIWLELHKFAKLFRDGLGGNTIFHTQFCEILEREDADYDFFDEAIAIMITAPWPSDNTQLLYKRR